MTRVLLFVCAILLAVAGTLGLVAQQATKSAREAQANAAVKATQLKEANEALTAFKIAAEKDREILSELLRRQTLRLKESEKARKGLENALKDHRDWADQPIPSGVLDAIDGVQASKPQGSSTPAAGLPNP